MSTSLRQKTLFTIVLTSLIALVGLYTLASSIIMAGASRLENEQMVHHISVVRNLLAAEGHALQRTVRDYSTWDDTYDFVAAPSDDYIESNFTEQTFQSLGIRFIAIFDSTKTPLFARTYDPERDAMGEPSPALREEFLGLLHTGAILKAQQGTTGLLMLPDGPYLVAIAPILTSNGEGPSRGVAIMGRPLDTNVIRQHESLNNFSLTLSNGLPKASVLTIGLDESAQADSVEVAPLSPTEVKGTAWFQDIYGEPHIRVEVLSQRPNFYQGQRSVFSLFGSLVATGIAFLIVIVVLMERLVLSRTERLHLAVHQIGISGDPTGRVPVDGSDELSNLAHEINQMLETINRSQQERQATEARYRDLVELSPDAIWVYGGGQILFANSAAAQLLGAAGPEQLVGRAHLELIHPDHRASAEARDAEMQATGQGSPLVEACFVRLDGSTVDGEAAATPCIYGGQPAFQVVVRNITARKQAEEALRQSESKYRLLMEQAADGIFLSDGLARYLEVNSQATVLSGYSREELLQLQVHELIDSEDLFQGALDGDQPQSGQTVMAERWLWRKDGTIIPVEVNARRLEDGRLQAIMRDITKRKRAEMLEHDRHQVLERVARNAPLLEVLTMLIEMVETQHPTVIGSVLFRRGDILTYGVGPHIPQGFIQALSEVPIGPMKGACGTAAYTRQMVISSDIANDPLWEGYIELALTHGLRACWSVPILSSRGEVLGTFALYAPTPGAPDAEELDLLAMACNLAAVAIEHRQLTDLLAHQARHDALTDLPNRLFFEERLGEALAQADAEGQQVAVLFVDLDRFKHINDTLGHDVGDALLKQVAERLCGCLGHDDFLARMGGDEFSLVLPALGEPEEAMVLAQHLLDSLRRPFTVGAHDLYVSASVGLSFYPHDGQDAATLHRQADSAMYRAKMQGRNNYQHFTPEMNAAAAERLWLETLLRRALEGELREFHLVYQPSVTVDGVLVACEALLRWEPPALGPIEPARFIPLAEETGLIVPIGEWLLLEACQACQRWQQPGQPPVRVTVNVSAVQFTQADFVEVVAHALRLSGLPPSLLELELTESTLMREYDDGIVLLNHLRALGVRIAVDDFGTGYSSLSYLQRLPLDTLKLDRSFVRGLGAGSSHDTETEAIVNAIITLAHSLEMRVVAEGVETAAQLEFLRTIGCDYVQGYLFARPMEAQAVTELIREAFSLLTSA